MNQQHEYPCTECGGNAFLAYTASEPEHWDGKVEIGERLCTLCFRKRMRFDMFSRLVKTKSRI